MIEKSTGDFIENIEEVKQYETIVTKDSKVIINQI